MTATTTTEFETEISADTAVAAAGRHGDQAEDDVVMSAVDCTSPIKYIQHEHHY